MIWLFFLFPPPANFYMQICWSHCPIATKIYIQTNKATTNIFGLHTEPRKTTRYTNILKLVWGGGGEGKGADNFPKKLKNIFWKIFLFLIFIIYVKLNCSIKIKMQEQKMPWYEQFCGILISKFI